jgi:hypothetical protein
VVGHRLLRDAADEFAQHPFVRLCDGVLDVIIAIDPLCLALGQATVANKMAGELCEALGADSSRGHQHKLIGVAVGPRDVLLCADHALRHGPLQRARRLSPRWDCCSSVL